MVASVTARLSLSYSLFVLMQKNVRDFKVFMKSNNAIVITLTPFLCQYYPHRRVQ